MKVRVSRKEPSSNGVSATQNKGTLVISLLGNGEAGATMLERKWNLRGPKMTAFHTMMLSGLGLPEIPMGASEVRRLKSRIRRRLAAVDYNMSQHQSP